MYGITSLSRSFSKAAYASNGLPANGLAGAGSADARPLGITTIIGTAFLSA